MYNQLKHVFIAYMSTTAYLIWHIPHGLKTSTKSVAKKLWFCRNDYFIDYILWHGVVNCDYNSIWKIVIPCVVISSGNSYKFKE